MLKFLKSEFGEVLGNKLYTLQQGELHRIIDKTSGKTKTQMRTLVKIILPRVALYKVLETQFGEKQKAYDTVEKYLFTCVSKTMNKFYSSLEFLPKYFLLFKSMTAGVITKSDNWSSQVIQNNDEALKFNITKCLWYEACIENGCPELCKVFCDCDHVIYNGLKNIKFVRKGTLGTGGDCCDFCFINKSKNM